jgi:L-seryl-tRNA(Ser) seleniumtransferase
VVADTSPEDPRRAVPRTDAVLDDPRIAERVAQVGRARVKAEVARAQEHVRGGALAAEALVPTVLGRLPTGAASMRPVLNATGVVLHTNLGRAPLSVAAVEAVVAASGATDVELDLATGRRARRGRSALDALREAVPDAEDVHVVNNGAAALHPGEIRRSVGSSGRGRRELRPACRGAGNGFVRKLRPLAVCVRTDDERRQNRGCGDLLHG